MKVVESAPEENVSCGGLGRAAAMPAVEGKLTGTMEETGSGRREMGNPSDREQLSSPVLNLEDQVAALLQNTFFFFPLPRILPPFLHG